MQCLLNNLVPVLCLLIFHSLRVCCPFLYTILLANTIDNVPARNIATKCFILSIPPASHTFDTLSQLTCRTASQLSARQSSSLATTPSSLHLSKPFYILSLSATTCTPCLSCLSCPFSSPDLSSPLDSQSSYLWGGSPDPSNFKVYRLRTILTAKRKWWKSKRSGDAQLVPGWSSTPKVSLIAPLLRTLHWLSSAARF